MQFPLVRYASTWNPERHFVFIAVRSVREVWQKYLYVLDVQRRTNEAFLRLTIQGITSTQKNEILQLRIFDVDEQTFVWLKKKISSYFDASLYTVLF
jgi:hypothetical protein